MYSVKLSQMPTPEGYASLKLKYDREASPTADNPLNGLFDYTTVAKKVLAEPATGVARKPFNHNSTVKNALLAELQRQNIHTGKFKLTVKKSVNTGKADPFKITIANEKASLRMAGSIEDVAINHGDFLENQKNNETGNSVEHLNWTIKLEGKDEPGFADAMQTLNTDAFRSGVVSRVRNGLKDGQALELINDAVKGFVDEKLSDKTTTAFKGKFSLKRPDVLDGALVVIGESQQFNVGRRPAASLQSAAQVAPENPSAKPRKYEDFSL